ncbi:Histone-lysine N-methyltransferase NSD2-like protein [Daphnia magna]|uniref:Histone-lysine N-methyltransferase NSD2-like protein n=1 Tax=Daphnia magna TaxID=35525 RepID=A0A164FYG5_9CRUS|nr:Histone-lysine N-methyltransferase NSD2-like protein [Daphnia magna]
MASAEHPETNGLVEKVNGTLVATLAAFVNFEHNDWDRGLQQAAFSINTAKQSTTQITPFELVYGRSAVFPHEASFPWPPDHAETHEERLKKSDQMEKNRPTPSLQKTKEKQVRLRSSSETKPPV